MNPRPRPERTPDASRRRALSAAACALLVAACAPLQPHETVTATARTPLAAFELEGRLSATDGTQAASGGLAWQHTPQADSLTLFSPLGSIVARLDSSPAGAVLTHANGTRHQAADADTLIPAVLGIDLPTGQFARWVQAAPGAGAEVRSRDAAGRPTLVIDQGWRIDYLAYIDASPQALPARLDITRGEARLRLIIDHWTTAQ
jgi:outer membrane lipoprotein LolB